ncbi:Transmembrane protein 234 homolog [Caenorhabditis elegans]|uniref:Transmembrane protein 234 homolog n=1 Tax=Caenorhabditis elegans TaxID=6239 RepID=Q4TT81_CAEEL|nr:Transmembrane protein 234 homolog [Caenorhabditis elegans]CCD66424.1 Transmembrane protein 234 homolog [Caenorhabditis elegans]|eukprot:NP_001021488.1 Uncharacterized protein CELE_F53F10.8 [Caenorhabditis elegans]
MSECGVQCILSIIVVGFVWGATNPLLRAASKDLENKKNGIILGFLKSFLNWRFSIPFALNQSGSVMFNALVVNFPVTVVVPCVNAIQFIATITVGWLMGEKMQVSTRKQKIGMTISSLAIIGMLIID